MLRTIRDGVGVQKTTEAIELSFTRRLENGVKAATLGGVVGAKVGGTITGGVMALGGTVFGPPGTFFGYSVGASAGAAVGSSICGTVCFVGGFLQED